MNPIQNAITGSTSGSASKVESPAARGAAPKGSTGAPAETAGAGETVSISHSARALATSASVAGSGVAAPRLAALQAAIASGTYRVDSKKIAQGLIRDSRALLKAGGR